ncbi:hypothetical protein RKE25_08275 [Dyella sp. BiH032]|uniref:hypothetical protein n=1 Tax=Dyella sp. BiH032 TaxID=3075430 RepID=UPI0028937DC0|nr:hypothetical protein [Dyella sp. BiH032]WNL47620.1 hypothetical protein RKE25_08275 [Dyella sp. BiH032]
MSSTGNHSDDKQRDTVPRRGDQAQGGIGHEAAVAGRRDMNPETGIPSGPIGKQHVRVSNHVTEDGDEAGEASGFTGDDGQHVPASTSAQPADLAPEQATAPEDGVSGRSGTGQAKTHRPFDESEGKQTQGQPVDPDSEASEPHVGASYQSGGTREDMAQQLEERKVQEPGGGAPQNPSGAADPAPGSQPGRNRTPGDRG